MKIITLDGNNISDIESFYDEVQLKICPSLKGFGRNLDALVDVMRGGFGPFDYGEKVNIEWRNSKQNEKILGFDTFNAIVDIIDGEGHKLTLS